MLGLRLDRMLVRTSDLKLVLELVHVSDQKSGRMSGLMWAPALDHQ
jgi:hypothetical protein